MNYFYEYNNPIATIRIVENGHAITAVKFTAVYPEPPSDAEKKETPLIKETYKQLCAYFDGQRIAFDVPLEVHGTDFQKSVWNALLTIPYGETRSYQQIAAIAGCPKGARAVGMANNRNPISIIVPCHRVIGADGNLTGYAAGKPAKQQLLQIESALTKSQI